MSIKKNALVIFYKYPEKSKVKIRLASGIGDKLTLKIYKAFLSDVFNSAATLRSNTDIIACVSGGDGMPVVKYAKKYSHILQRGGDVATRMGNAFLDIFARGYSRCILIGCDSPGLSAAILKDAFEMLNGNDVVLGPNKDGSYYLIGFNSNIFYTGNLSDLSWSVQGGLSVNWGKNSTGFSCSLLQQLDNIYDNESLSDFFRSHEKGSLPGKTYKYLRSAMKRINEKKI